MHRVQEQHEDQLAEVLALGRASLAAYATAMQPSFALPKHVKLIVNRLEALEAGIIKRLIVCVPPRHGKTLTSQLAMAWALGRNPQASVIFTSYSQDLSDDGGRRVRNLIAHPMHSAIFPGSRLSSDSTSMQKFALVQGGMFYAAGMGASITGRGADLLVIDDAVKDQETASSPTMRRNIWEWFQSTAYPRLEPGGRAVVIGTRWHADDLIGRILREHKGEGWELLSLPALAEEGDALGREVGAALWPERFTAEDLQSTRRTVSSRTFLSLFQQNPVAAEGNTFKREWWRYYEQEPEGVTRKILSLDSAFKSGEQNDYSAWTIWGQTKNGFYLLHAGRERCEFPELKRKLVMLASVWHPSMVLIEDRASGQSLIQELRRETTLPIKAVKADKDKATRASAATGLVECGKVFLPQNAPWLADYLDELSAFPAAPHDDWVDSTTQFLNYIRALQPGAVSVHFWTGSGRSMDWAEYSALDWAGWELWRSSR